MARSKRRWILAVTAAALTLASLVVLGYFGVVWFVSPSRERFPVRGIDVSHHQGEIAWDEVAGSGQIDFAYLKASEGGDWVDPSFARNWAATAEAGIPRGAYHYFTLCRSGIEQADHFIATVPRDDAALPPVIDLEFVGNCTKRPAVSDVVAEVEAFSAKVERHYGRRPLIYTTEEFLRRSLGGELPGYELWLRDLFGEPDFAASGWRLWQFHSRARVPGIDGPTDLDVFNGTPAEFEAWRSRP